MVVPNPQAPMITHLKDVGAWRGSIVEPRNWNYALNRLYHAAPMARVI